MRIHGVEMIEESDQVVKAFVREGDFEPETVALWNEYQGVDRIAIDIGTYTGLFSILARKRGSRVRGFEPNSHARLRALKNAANNGCSLDIAVMAVSNRCGLRKFSTHGRGIMTSAGSLAAEGTPIYATSLNAVLSFADAIKIDVEGEEAKVIQGAHPVISASRPLIIAETLDDDARERVLAEMDRHTKHYRHEFLDGRNLAFIPK